jgi:redox-sensitive bicupin YhaK (pirin superfamily)
MIQVYPAESRFSADHGWLKSNFSFSFADYYDPDNLNFGPLRVLNDDIVQPGRGFGSHPHREMEIVSIVLKGQLKHEDSTGNTATSTYGEIQRMSAGTGIIHSETNPSEDEEVHLLQLWFLPSEEGLTPSYEHSSFDTKKMKNTLLPVVSKQSSDGVAYIHQDMTIHLSELEANTDLLFTQAEGRRIYVFVIEGDVTLNDGTALKKRDAARITEHSSLKIASNTGANFMLIDLP